MGLCTNKYDNQVHWYSQKKLEYEYELTGLAVSLSSE